MKGLEIEFDFNEKEGVSYAHNFQEYVDALPVFSVGTDIYNNNDVDGVDGIWDLLDNATTITSTQAYKDECGEDDYLDDMTNGPYDTLETILFDRLARDRGYVKQIKK